MSDTTETTPVEPLKPRVGTILWGGILLVVAAVTLFASQIDLGETTPEALVWSVVVFGGVLVLAGIVTAVVRAARNGREQI